MAWTPPEAKQDEFIPPEAQDIGSPIDLDRPILNNPDGSFSTERSITVGLGNKFYNLPTIIDGKEVSPDDAVAAFRSGRSQHLGVFDNEQEALAAAQARTKEIGRLRSDEAGQGFVPPEAAVAPGEPDALAQAQDTGIDKLKSVGGAVLGAVGKVVGKAKELGGPAAEAFMETQAGGPLDIAYKGASAALSGLGAAQKEYEAQVHKPFEDLGKRIREAHKQDPGRRAQAWDAIGKSVEKLPTLVELFVVGGPALPSTEMTAAGRRVAGLLEEANNVRQPVGGVLQEGMAAKANAVKLDKGSTSSVKKAFTTAVKAEEKVKALSAELDEVLKAGPEGLEITKQEAAWTQKVAELKDERDALAEVVKEGNFAAMMKPRDEKLVAKLDGLRQNEAKAREAVAQIDERLNNARRRLQVVEEQRAAIRAMNPNMNVARQGSAPELHRYDEGYARYKAIENIRGEIKKAVDDLEKIREKAFAKAEAAGSRTKSAASQLMDIEDKRTIDLATKLNDMDRQVIELKSKYQQSLERRFVAKRDDIMESAAYAENDMRELGYTAEEVQQGFVNQLERNGEAIRLPATVEEARQTATITQGGVPVSGDLISGIRSTEDLKPTETHFFGLKYITDKLDKSANGAFRREVEQPILNNINAYRTREAALYKREADIRKKFKLSDADSTPLRRFIEGKADAPAGKQAAYAAAKEEYKAIYDKALDLVNSRRQQMGKAPIPRREDYVHHIRQQVVADDLGVMPEEMGQAFAASKEKKVGFDEKRFDAIEEDELGGAFDAVQAYISKAAAYSAHAEDAERVYKLMQEAKAAGKPQLALYLKNLHTRLTGDASRLSRKGLQEATGGAANRPVMDMVNKVGANFAKNVISGNFGAALNQVGSMIMTAQYLGWPRAVAASVEGLSAPLWEKVVQATRNPEYRAFAKQHSKTLRLFQLEAVKRKAISETPKLDAVGMWAFNYMNEAMVVGTFNQAFKAAKQAGKSFQEAVSFADEISQRANGIYEDVFRPAFVSDASPIGKIMMPISTYVFNSANALSRDVLFAGLKASEKVAVLGHMIAAGTIANVAVSSVSGREGSFGPADFVPFLRQLQWGFSGALDPKNLNPLSANPYLLLANKYGFGLQAIKTAKGAMNIASGENSDPRQLLFGAKKEEPQ